jgi:hypothetical protein
MKKFDRILIHVSTVFKNLKVPSSSEIDNVMEYIHLESIQVQIL